MTDSTAEALKRVRERLEAGEPGHIAKLRERQAAQIAKETRFLMPIENTIHAEMCGLVDDYGSYESIVAGMRERFDPRYCQSTLSKRMNRLAGYHWTLNESVFLQRRLRKTPVLDALNRHFSDVTPALAPQQSLLETTRHAIREHSEAVDASLIAAQTGSPENIATALKETRQAIESLRVQMLILEARARHGAA